MSAPVPSSDSSRGLPLSARTWRLTVLVVLVAFLAYPVVSSLLVQAQLKRSGVDVVARVVGTSDEDGKHAIGYVLPEEVDPEERVWTAEVDPSTYAEAERTKRVQVRVLEDRPEVHRVEGEQTNRTSLVISLVLIAAVLAVGVVWVRRGRRRPAVRLRAEADLESAESDPQGGALSPLAGDRYEVVGEVLSADDAQVVVRIAERRVVVLLDGHHNPVPVGSVVRARGPLVG